MNWLNRKVSPSVKQFIGQLSFDILTLGRLLRRHFYWFQFSTKLWCIAFNEARTLGQCYKTFSFP